MRFITLRLTTVLATVAVAGLALVHAQAPPVPPMQQTPPVQQTTPPPPGTVITTGVPLAPPLPPCPAVPPGLSDIGPMLDRITAIVNQSVGDESKAVSLAAKEAGGVREHGSTSTMGETAPIKAERRHGEHGQHRAGQAGRDPRRARAD